MCGHFFDHGVGSVIAKALPIAAAFIPGVGPLVSAALTAGAGALSSKLQGANWGDSLKMGALSGAGAAFAPIAGNALSGAFPETMGSLGINGGYDTVFGQGTGSGALNFSGLGSSGAASLGNEQISGALAAADPTLSTAGNAASAASTLSPGTEKFLAGLSDPASTAGNGGFLSNALTKIENNPVTALGALASVANAAQGGKVNGEQTQSQILAQQQAKAAQDAAFSNQTISALNTASSGRSIVNPNISDYYTYGRRPEATFFSQAKPINYGATS